MNKETFSMNNPMKNLTKILRMPFTGPAFFWMAAMLSNILNWLFNLQLGRNLSKEEFAIITVFVSFQYLIMVPASALSTTITRFVAYYIGKGEQRKHFYFFRQYWWLSWAMGIFLFILFLLTQNIISDFLHISPSFLMYIFSAIFIPLFLVSFEKGILSGQLAFIWVGVLLIVESLTRLLMITLLDHLPFADLTIAVVSLPVSVMVAWFISLLITRSFHPLPVKNNHSASTNLSETYNFLANSFFAGLGVVLIYNVDILLVKHFFSASEAGVYSTLSLLGKMLYFGAGSLVALLIPLTAKSNALNESGRKGFNILLGIVSTVGVFIWGLYVFIPEMVVTALLTEKGLVALPYLSSYTLGMLFLVLSYCYSTFHLARKNYLPSRLIIVASLIQILFIFLFHNSLNQVVNTVSLTMFGLFVMIVLCDLLHITSTTFSINLSSFINLFFDKVSFGSGVKANKRRILIFNWRDIKHTKSGGAEVYIDEIFSRLVKQGYDVTLFTSNDGQNIDFEKIHGINIIRKGGFVTVYLWAAIYYIFRMRGKFDIIIDSENGIPFFTPLFVKKPIILLVHHVHQDVFLQSLIPPFSWIANFLETYVMPNIYRKCQIVAVSESTAEELTHQIGLTDALIIQNGVNTETFKKSSKSKTPLISYVGRLKQYKSIDVLILAFASLLKDYPQAKLIIAGSGDSSQKLQELTHTLGIFEQVSFLGKVTETEKIKILSSSWVMVQPSSQEGWGITCLEANACETPVLASNVAGLKDAVKEGESGYLFEYGDHRQLSQRLRELITSKVSRKNLGVSARRWSECYSWDIQSHKYHLLIQGILNDTTIRGRGLDLADLRKEFIGVSEA